MKKIKILMLGILFLGFAGLSSCNKDDVEPPINNNAPSKINETKINGTFKIEGEDLITLTNAQISGDKGISFSETSNGIQLTSAASFLFRFVVDGTAYNFNYRIILPEPQYNPNLTRTEDMVGTYSHAINGVGDIATKRTSSITFSTFNASTGSNLKSFITKLGSDETYLDVNITQFSQKGVKGNMVGKIRNTSGGVITFADITADFEFAEEDITIVE